MQAHALADLDRCDKDWCKIKVGGASGWTPAGEVWGAADAPQCR
jgi:SH3-like domain-containing protein